MRSINFKNIGIIFYENPISRAYLKFLENENIEIKNFFYLNNRSFLPNKINAYKFFRKNNFYAINFLNDRNIIKLISQFEEFFELQNNFCVDMYKFANFGKNNSINYISNKSINSDEMRNVLSDKKFEDIYFLNTGNEILKNILKLKINFFHIHPGYLPEVRGADGSLNSILKHNSLGVSSFVMTNKIDEGDLIMREKLNIPKFKFDNYKEYSLKDIYRIWYSFFDPLLRVSHLKKLYEVNTFDLEPLNISQDSNYYSFLDNNSLRNVFNKIFN